jgi:iron complex outermembrane receptor protein
VKDGASALYGSDAVAGVINIILRENYQGAAVGGTVGSSYKGDGTHTGINGSWGHGDIASDRYNVFVSVEASKDKNINDTQRPDWLGTSDLRPWGSYDGRRGAYLNPNGGGQSLFPDQSGPLFSATTPYGTLRTPGGNQLQRANLSACPSINPLTGVCLFDEVAHKQIQPDAKRTSIYARGAYQFNDSVQGYLELGMFKSKVDVIGTPGSLSDGGVFNPADPLNPVIVHTTTIPGNHPDNPFGGTTRRTLSLLTTMFGGRDNFTDSTVTRTIVGLKGNVSRWRYDVGVGYIESKLDQDRTGFVSFSALTTAINNLTFRVNPALMSPTLIAAISPTLSNTAKNSIAIADATMSGDLMDLPGGKLGIAFGTEYRKEKADSPPTPGTDTSDIVGLGYSAFTADRNDTAAYVELDAPLAKILELNGAYRYDKYSDYGHSATPKLGFKLTPIPQFSLRGTYSEAFRAPGPTESGKSSSLGFTSIGIITIGDPSVRPETAKSYTFGFVAEPVHGTSISVDYYSIKRSDEINPADPAIVVGNLPQTGTPNSKRAGLTPNSFLFYDVNGQLATISAPYANINSTTTSGIDVDLRNDFNFANGWRLESGLLWTHLLKWQRKLNDGTKLDYVGTHGPYVLSSGNGTPEDRASVEFTLSKSKLTMTARVNYVSSLKMIDNNGETITPAFTLAGKTYYDLSAGESGGTYVADPSQVCGTYGPNGLPPNHCRLPSFTTLDLSGKWAFSDHAELTLALRNALNRIAPLDPYLAGGYRINYNSAFHQDGAVGSFGTLGFKYKF